MHLVGRACAARLYPGWIRGGQEMPNKIFRGVLYAASVVLAGVAWRLVYLHYVQDTMMEMAERQQVTQLR